MDAVVDARIVVAVGHIVVAVAGVVVAVVDNASVDQQVLDIVDYPLVKCHVRRLGNNLAACSGEVSTY